MTILILDQFSDLGGAQLSVLDVVPGMLAEGWTVHAAAPEGPLLAQLRRRGAAVHRLETGRYSHGRKGLLDAARYGARLSALVRRVRELAAEGRPDVIYVNGPRLMPPVALAKPGCAVVFHSHNRIGGAAQRALVRAAIRSSRATVVAASAYAAAQWRPARVIYGGVEGPAREPARAHTEHCVGMIGRISPQKGQKEFVVACARLSAARPDLRFLVCGDVLFDDAGAHGYKRGLARLAPPALRFLPWTEDVYSVLAELDLLVVPSAGEGGIPRVALEAFAAGVPVLAHASGAVTEAIVEGRTGFLLRSGAACEIAARVAEALADRAALSHVARQARALWEQRFTAARHRAEICALLLEVASGDMMPAIRRGRS
jgi:glycosyltransferase involved in cell wall biosynthesis